MNGDIKSIHFVYYYNLHKEIQYIFILKQNNNQINYLCFYYQNLIKK
jgi:hypothetical protein